VPVVQLARAVLTKAEDSCAETAADAAALLRMVDALPSKQRQVVMLFYIQEQR